MKTYVVEPNKDLLTKYQDKVKRNEDGVGDIGYEWHNQTFQEFGKTDQKYHFISAIHSMYFLGNPEGAITSLYSLLEQGGMMLIVVSGKGRLQNPTAGWPAVPSGSGRFLLFLTMTTARNRTEPAVDRRLGLKPPLSDNSLIFIRWSLEIFRTVNLWKLLGVRNQTLLFSTNQIATLTSGKSDTQNKKGSNAHFSTFTVYLRKFVMRENLYVSQLFTGEMFVMRNALRKRVEKVSMRETLSLNAVKLTALNL